jgi:hypothetical protein
MDYSKITRPLALRSSDNFEVVRRHLAALGIGDELEAHLLTIAQIAYSRALDGADMDKGVIAAIVRCNEPETLLGIEPFHGSRNHEETLSQTELVLPCYRRASNSLFFREEDRQRSAKLSSARPSHQAVYRHFRYGYRCMKIQSILMNFFDIYRLPKKYTYAN